MSTMLTIMHDGAGNGEKRPLVVSVCESENGNELESYTVRPGKSLNIEMFDGCFLSLASKEVA